MNNQIMTAQEVSEKYDISLSSLTSNFPRSQDTIYKKYGVKLEKIGRGKTAQYHVASFNHSDPSRALTLYQSLENNQLSASTAAGLVDMHFLVFIGIVSSPQRAFRGSYIDLLNYLEIKPSAEAIDNVRMVLTALAEKDYIMYMEDKTNNMYFMAGILKKAEDDMELEIEAILGFKRLVEKSRKSWIPLMQVYLTLHFIAQPCTVKDISQITGLTEYRVRDSLSIFEKNNIILKNTIICKDPISQSFYCLGSNIDINTFGF